MALRDIGKAKYKITMKDGYIEDCYATQYDTARVFEFQVFNDSQMMSLSGITIKMMVEQGTKVVFATGSVVNADQGIFQVVLNSEMLENDSIHYAQIEMSNGSESIQSPPFKIKIGKSIKTGAKAGVNIVVDYAKVKQYIDEITHLRLHTDELKGPKGDKPVITINDKGNWVIDNVDTGKRAIGQDGKMSFEELSQEQKNSLKGAKGDKGDAGPTGPKGDKPVITIQNGNWYVDGVDTRQKAKGEDGQVTFEALTPTQKASLKGDKGDPGANGQPGAKGDKGEQGLPGEVRVLTQAEYNALTIAPTDRTFYLIKKEV